MSTQPDTISVLMTVHNEERFVQQALESLKSQTFQNFEVIIVNDGSTDGTAAILNRFSGLDSRFQIFHEHKQGRSHSLNLAFRYSRGKLIAIMDSDDIALPQRLERQLAFLRAHPELGMVGAYYEQIDALGNPIKRLNEIPLDPAVLREKLAVENPICHGTVMAHREVLAEAGLYREAFQAAVDYDLYLRVLGRSEIGMIPEILYQYRVHGTAMSSKRLLQLQMKSMAASLYRERLESAPIRLPDQNTGASGTKQEKKNFHTGQDSLQRLNGDSQAQKYFVEAFLANDLQANRKHYSQILWELGRKYYRLGETDAAIQSLKSSFRLDASRFDTLRYLGKAYLKKLTGRSAGKVPSKS